MRGATFLAVTAIRDAYTMTTVYGFVLDDIGDPVSGADVTLAGASARTNVEGYFEVAVHEDVSALSVRKEGYAPQELSIQNGDSRLVTVELKPVQSSRWHMLKKQVLLWREKFW